MATFPPDTRLPRGVRDLELTNRLLREKAYHEYHKIFYRREVKVSDLLDDIHMEVPEADREFEPPRVLYMQMRLQGDNFNLTKFLTDRDFAFQIQIPTIMLEDLGLAVRYPDRNWCVEHSLYSGDRFEWSGREFYVVQATLSPEAYWINTAYALFVVLTAKLFRKESTSLPVTDEGLGRPDKPGDFEPR